MPSFGFGTSTRDGNEKRMLSKKAQSLTGLGTQSPGPIYKLKSSVGAQYLSANSTAPSHVFGKRDDPRARGGAPVHPPGPGTYEMMNSLGGQILSGRRSESGVTFGSGNRWSAYKKDFVEQYMTPAATTSQPAKGWLGDAASFSFGGGAKRSAVGMGPGKPSYVRNPGPGTYQEKSSMGDQIESKRSSAQNAKFGTSQRGAKLYVNRSSERETLGKHSPGPNTYNLSGSVGRQSSSTKKSAQSFVFGSSDRFSETKAVRDLGGAPGPGTYRI